jgi:hypothetical protein
MPSRQSSLVQASQQLASRHSRLSQEQEAQPLAARVREQVAPKSVTLQARSSVARIPAPESQRLALQ